MKTIKVGGVPEHFNWPWRLAMESGRLLDLGVELRWQDYPGGSGVLSQALEVGELDLALLLTEAAATAIANGARHRIVSWYTQSPLIWGIHVPSASDLTSVNDIQGARYAISRHGSGSHLMCFAHAEQQAWDLSALNFVVVGGLQGAVDAFRRGQADVFFWEKYMTQPLVESGEFRRVGEFVAPWPAFVLCAAEAQLADPALAIAVLGVVLSCAAGVAAAGESAEQIAAQYGLAPADVSAWLQTTRWASAPGIDTEVLARVLQVLEKVGLAPAGHAPENLLVP